MGNFKFFPDGDDRASMKNTKHPSNIILHFTYIRSIEQRLETLHSYSPPFANCHDADTDCIVHLATLQINKTVPKQISYESNSVHFTFEEETLLIDDRTNNIHL